MIEVQNNDQINDRNGNSTKPLLCDVSILELEEGTKVKIRKDVKCAEIFHNGGNLIFGNSKEEAEEGDYDFDEDGFYFGIEIEEGVSYRFKASEYVLI